MTETDELSAALDAAARRWPKLSRGQLVVRLALEGHRAAADADEQRRQRRRAAVARVNSTLTGVYGEGYLASLREDWPR